jgi:hypothetical protein
MRRQSIAAPTLLAALFGLFPVVQPSPARGDMMTFVTPTGSMTGGQPVDATATFTTGLNTVTITLKNLESNPKSDIENINGLVFTFSKAPTSVSLTSSSGVQRTVASDLTYSDVSASPTIWKVSLSTPPPSPPKVTLTTIGNAHAPETVIGGPAGDNKYDAANGSIAGSNHNPFLAGTVTFTLNVQGIDATTSISSVVFAYGTADTTSNVIVGHAVPEPSSLALAGLGGVACLAIRRRRSRRR